jgi:hypothetical protein
MRLSWFRFCRESSLAGTRDNIAGLFQHADAARNLQSHRTGCHRKSTQAQVAGSGHPGYPIKFLLQYFVTGVNIEETASTSFAKPSSD